MHTQIVTITPAMAREYLKRNLVNRPLHPKEITRYANEMTRGAFRLNGEPVIISKTGRLMDGQHRLHGCIQADRPFQTLLVHGVEDDVFPTLGTGIKRTGSDVLSLNGEKNASALTAALNMVWSYQRGTLGSNKQGATNQDRVDLLKCHPGLRESVRYASTFPKGIGPSSVAAIHYLAEQAHPDEANEFFEQFRTGAGVKDGDPALVLRERLLNRKKNSAMVFAKGYVPAIIIKAFNAHLQGGGMRFLVWKATTEDFPAINGAPMGTL